MIVSGGIVVTPTGPILADVVIEAGRIARLAPPGAGGAAAEVIDARGLHVLPGLIDSHVHFRTPGATEKEDFTTGSLAAIAGGVTTVVDMPNNVPPITSARALREKIDLISGTSFVDYALLAALVPENAERLAELAAAGAAGFKLYLGETTGQLAAPDDGALLAAMADAAALGRPIAIHAENDAIVRHARARLQRAGRVDALAHLESRPSVAEEEAIRRAATLARYAGAEIHICHLSSAGGLRAVVEARAAGQPLTAEATPHHLLLDDTCYSRLGNLARINPPIRYPRDREALWEGIRAGVIQILASDHSPHLPREKAAASVWDAPSGFPGVQTLAPLLLTQVHQGTLSLEDFVRLAAENPARRWDLFPRKGAIVEGADADLAIIDLDRQWTIRGAGLLSKSQITPYEGWSVWGMPWHTLVGGRIVWRAGKRVGRPAGRFLTPA